VYSTRDSDAVAFCKRVERAAKERASLELFGVSYEAVDNEPFCETVYRWLHGDAPGECRECADGKYAELVAMAGRGECEVETTENWLPAEQYHRCKHCGAFFAVMDASGDIPPCVCPNCGKAVKR
jgi:hypothetical protein